MRNFIQNLIKYTKLIFINIFVLIVVLEVLLRISGAVELHSVLVLEQNSNTYLPRQSAVFKHVEWDYQININNDGFRDDIDLKDVGPNSIVVLGDSFTEGYGVALEDTYVKILEKELTPSGFGDVYNAGHTDSGIAYYKKVYDTFIRTNENIQTVIVGFYVGNDFVHPETPLVGDLSPRNRTNSVKEHIITFLNENSMAYIALNVAVKSNEVLRSCANLLDAALGKILMTYSHKKQNSFF